MTYALDKTSPLAWWRTVPPSRLDATHRYTLRRSLSQIAIFGEPGWRRAVAGDAAEAIGIALPLIHRGVNPHIQQHIASLPATEHERLKGLSDTEPAGLLQVSDGVDPDYTEGSELTYLHGVAIADGATAPDDLDAIEVPAGTWTVFRIEGPYPAALQDAWAATATEWFPSNPWRLRPGPSIVAVLERADDFSTATVELWLPVERA